MFFLHNNHFMVVCVTWKQSDVSPGISCNDAGLNMFLSFKRLISGFQFLPQDSIALVEEEIVMILRIPSALCSQYAGFKFHRKQSLLFPPPPLCDVWSIFFFFYFCFGPCVIDIFFIYCVCGRCYTFSFRSRVCHNITESESFYSLIFNQTKLTKKKLPFSFVTCICNVCWPATF